MTMTPRIRGIGLAVPPYVHTQKEMLAFMCEAHGLDPKQARYLRVLYDRSRIDTRHSCIPTDTWRNFEFFPRSGQGPAPSTARRMERFREIAPQLGIEACRNLFAAPGMPDPSRIDHLFAVSCTGFFAPGMDVLVARALGLRPDVGRTLIGFQGCQGGLTALRLANEICRARPGAHVLVVCSELCTLHFQLDATEENLLANALFADGAAAVLIGGAESGERSGPEIRIEGHSTFLRPDSEDDMVWTVGDTGFLLRLSQMIPRVLANEVPPVLERAFGLSREELREIPIWAVHPGGAAILEGVERGLELPEGRLDRSRAVLRRYGNMSSPTIFFILRDVLEGASPGPGIALAFGPGLTVEATRFELA